MVQSEKKFLLLAFLILTFLFIFIFRGLFILKIIVRSFMDNSVDYYKFIGLKNYLALVKNHVFQKCFINSLKILFYIPVLLLLSLIISIKIFEQHRFAVCLKFIIVMPQIVSMVVVTSVIGSLFGYYGPINSLLSFISIKPLNWFGENISAFFIIITCILYSMLGWQVLIFSGALSLIDRGLEDLMKIDGLAFLERMLIYSALLRKSILCSVILNVIYAFSGFFPIIFSLTNGGPGYNTTTIDFLIYLRSFKIRSELSEVFTLSSLLLVIVICFSSLVFRLLRRVA